MTCMKKITKNVDRIFRIFKNFRIIILVLIPMMVIGIIGSISPVLADDTGTYQIQKYDVILTPHYDGDITISIDQKWLVTGGHIPWVTVGLPNSNYDVQDFGGAAQSVKPDNGGGWDGVRVDLNKDYQPQESFDFNFTIVQRGLLEKSGDGYKLGYTPGWYDRAFTDELNVKLVSPAKVEELKTDPQPNSVNGQNVIWTRKNLGKGEKFSVTINFPNGTYNNTLMNQSQGGGDMVWIIIIAIVVIAFFAVLSIAVSSESGSSYRSSDYYYGSESIEERRRRRKKKDDDDYTSPIIYSGASRGSSHSSHSSGGGGGFGGRSTSCACACVSCACACACAGGGGAGCKKLQHFCQKCSKKNNVEKNE